MHRRGFTLGVLALTGLLGCESSTGSDAPATKTPPATKADDPGRVTVHRLNRAEYNNTVRDLLGTTLRPADDFPADDHSYGFDNIADALTISPVQLELYVRASEALAAEALAVPAVSQQSLFQAEDLTGTAGGVVGTTYNLWSAGVLPVTVTFPTDGKYKISTRVWGDQAGPEPVKMSLSVGNVLLGAYDVTATAGAPVVLEATLDGKAGSQVVTIEFLNDYYEPDLGLDRNLIVDWIQVDGPIGAVGDNPIRDRLFLCDPAIEGKPCAREILTAFATRAFRRPVAEAEIDALMSFLDLAESQDDTLDSGIELALTAIFTSPEFLFRVEIDPAPASLEPHLLGPYELASRLSYFLWSSMPDDELFAAAGDGRLDTASGIREQVARMLADPRSEAIIDNFAGQWLYTRALSDHQTDYAAYPSFDEPLRAAMSQETKLFMSEFLHGDRPVNDMLTADFTFLDGRLAQHYGLPAPAGDGFQQVTLDSAQRGGVLTQASLLTVTSFPARTSPVKRGKWILMQLLCSEPPPPPPGVEGLKDKGDGGGTIREQLEEHRKNPTCAACHDAMDPLGFGLEHFDGIGAWREADHGDAVDATGVLPTGEPFDGAKQMAALVAQDPRFDACVADKLFTYALGRGTSVNDATYVDAAVDSFQASGARLRELVALVATSDPFRMRRGEAEPKMTGGTP